jgi:hypothetical protein
MRFRRGPFLCSALIADRTISNNGRSIRRPVRRRDPPAIGPETNDKKSYAFLQKQPARPRARRRAA